MCQTLTRSVEGVKYLILGFTSRNLVKKGCQWYLAYLMNKQKGEDAEESMIVVKEYSNVIPSSC
jgi:hypothetical protein